MQLQRELQAELWVAELRARGWELPTLGTTKGSGDVGARRLDSRGQGLRRKSKTFVHLDCEV